MCDLFALGIIAGALAPMGDSFSDFNTVKQGIVTTSILLGALIGSAYGNAYSFNFIYRIIVWINHLFYSI